MYNNDLIAYYQQTKKYPRLSKTEEKELLQKTASGDKAAREKLITHNLRLVFPIVREYIGPGTDTMDLVQQGNLGLIYAIDHYDPTRKTALSTAATYGIKNYISKYYFDQSRTVRKPQWQQEMTSKIRDAENTLKEKLERTPTDKEIATYLGVVEETIQRIRKDNAVKHISLTTPLDEHGNTVEDLIAAPENKEASQERYKRAIEKALKHLSEEDAELLSVIYGINGYPKKSQEQIAKERGVSREMIRQKKEAALRKLRHPDILSEIRGEL